MDWIIFILISYIFGVGVLVFLGGRMVFNLEDNLMLVIFWPFIALMGLVIVPFYVIYELGKESKTWVLKKKAKDGKDND